MPSAAEILEQAFAIASRFRALAVAWHLGVGVVVLLALRGWRPSRRVTAVLLAAPLSSVAVIAALVGNPFNSVGLGLLAVAVLAIGLSPGPAPRPVVNRRQRLLPAALVAFGLLYPHFLPGTGWAHYLYAAPLGLLPCPTLALVAGATLLVQGLGSRLLRYLMAAWVLMYGLLGVFRLGVLLDVALLVAAAALVAQAAGERRSSARRSSAGRKDGLLRYFGLAFAISWTAVVLAIWTTGLGSAPGPSLGATALVFLAMLAGPSGAAIGLTAWLEGRAGLGRLGAAILRWRLPGRWYAMVVVAPALMALVLAGLSLGWPGFRPEIFTSTTPGQIAAAALIAGLAAGFFEELGWTGFATRRLLDRWGVVRAGLTLGLPWALWHALPDFWGSGRSFGVLWPVHMVQWVVALTAFRVLMTWAYARTGSLPLAMLMHAGFTGGQALLWPATRSPVEGLMWYGYFAAMLSLVALWFVSPATTPSRPRRREGEPQRFGGARCDSSIEA